MRWLYKELRTIEPLPESERRPSAPI
jgi:hypothetical protein